MGTLLMTSLLATAIPLGAFATLADDSAARAASAPVLELGAEAPAAADPAGAPARTTRVPAYMLRCWQYGHLLFEEEVHDIPASSASGPAGTVRYRMRLNDAERSPLVLLEINGALCSVRRGADGAGRK